MTFSKRPRPMSFGRPDEEAQEAGAPFEETGQPGSRRPHPAIIGHRLPVHEVQSQALSAEGAHDFDAHRRAFEDDAPPGWPIWLAGVAIALLWALGPIAFAVGYRGDVAPFRSEPFALTVFALLSIGPAVFVLGAAYMIRQGQKLAFETRRAKAMAEDMLLPALVAAAGAGDVAQSVRDEIARAGQAAEEARETLVAMRDALAFETDKLAGATAQSVRTAQELASTLGRERAEMAGLAQTLDTQATRVTDALGQQARMVTDAVGVAEAQVREAGATLSATAADLSAAASEAGGAARVAAEDLSRHIVRLEAAGAGVAEQAKAVESGLNAQRTALAALGQTLKADHESLGADAEAYAERLNAIIDQARLASAEMGAQAAGGGEVLHQLVAEAAERFRDLAETAKAERDEFGQSTLQALEAVSSAATEQRAALETQTRAAIEALAAAANETRVVASRHASEAREQVDQLSEAAFSAGQRANKVFEARLEEAKALVEGSARMVEDAGEMTIRKLEAGAMSARAMLDELNTLLADVEARSERMPAVAREQAEEVRAAITEGLDELMVQARRTTEEAQAMDAAFQDRMRRNFEMLSEGVRLMGVAADTALAEAPVLPPSAPGDPGDEAASPPDAAAGADLADRIGLRNRIRLTPTATDREFSAVFEAAGGPPAPSSGTGQEDADEDDGDAWTWKDLLASLDGADEAGERLEDSLAAELARMGVEPDKLLPTSRVDEIAAAVQAGDLSGAREVVRRLAPAATRRIARRLFTDDAVKRQAETYLRRYKTLVDDAIARDPQGAVVTQLLQSESGRVFLLFDTAGGEMI